MFLRIYITIWAVFLTAFAANAQYVRHHTKYTELVNDGSFEEPENSYYYEIDRGLFYRVSNNSDGCYDAFDGSHYAYIDDRPSNNRLNFELKDLLSENSVYNFSFRLRRAYEDDGGASGYSCSSNYMHNATIKIYLSEFASGYGRTQYLGSFSTDTKYSWPLREFTVKPDAGYYNFIYVKVETDDLFKTAVILDDFSMQECGALTCSRTAGKITQPMVYYNTIDNNSIIQIIDKLDNVSNLTVKCNGKTAEIINPNGIKYYATNGSEFGLTDGDYNLEFTMKNDCDELKFTHKIHFGQSNTANPIVSKNYPNAPSIPRYQCASDLTVYGDYLIHEDTFGAKNTIQTSGTVSSSQNLSFVAGTRITLNPGFSATGSFTTRLETVSSLKSGEISEEDLAMLDSIPRAVVITENNDLFVATDVAEVPANDGSDKFIVHPNPVRDILSISGPISEEFQFELFSAKGSLLISGKNTSVIDVSENESGKYWLKIISAKGIQIERIIKEY